jgi:hypothetical protein
MKLFLLFQVPKDEATNKLYLQKILVVRLSLQSQDETTTPVLSRSRDSISGSSFVIALSNIH